VVKSTTRRAPAALQQLQGAAGCVERLGQGRPPAGAEVTLGEGGLRFTVPKGSRSLRCRPVIGQYNVSNLLGVLAALRAGRAAGAGLPCLLRHGARARPHAADRQPASRWWPWTTPTPRCAGKGPARCALAQARGGRLWCVFGCGGDRDAASAR
jgi:UDP-N-acetylmuramoyl-L-alanyl-D-glutamate--2,6-diaminopimelate ligase